MLAYGSEREDSFSNRLHTNDEPAILLRLVVECLGESADFGVRESFGRAVGILALGVVVQYEHRKRRAVAGFRCIRAFGGPGGVAERGERPAADHQVDALGLSGVVVVEQKLGFLDQDGLPILS